MEKKQTTVKWLMNELTRNGSDAEKTFVQIFKQANKMFEEQIQDAYWDGGQNIPIHGTQCEQYYNETFKSK